LVCGARDGVNVSPVTRYQFPPPFLDSLRLLDSIHDTFSATFRRRYSKVGQARHRAM
jgi:hypothetical protein